MAQNPVLASAALTLLPWQLISKGQEQPPLGRKQE